MFGLLVRSMAKTYSDAFYGWLMHRRIRKARGKPRPTVPFDCPKCTLLVPPTSSQCPDCGYRFEWQEK
jgi:hypothetical protein